MAAPAKAGASDDVKHLPTALTSISNNYATEGIKCMTTDLDNVMLELKPEFAAQHDLCECFRGLALMYRPIRTEGVATVVSLKYFADSSYKMLLPMLEKALNDGSVEDTKEVMNELVDMYLKVHGKLQGLKKQHNEITVDSKKLGNQAAAKAKEHSNESALMKTKGETAGSASAGGGVGLGAAAVTMVCVGAGPIGWCCLAGAAAVTAGAGGRLAYATAAEENHKVSQSSAHKINDQMLRVTDKLAKQCMALEEIVTLLSDARDSTEKIRKIVDEWAAGKAKSKMKQMRFEKWLESLPDDMTQLSIYCQKYLGGESKE